MLQRIIGLVAAVGALAIAAPVEAQEFQAEVPLHQEAVYNVLNPMVTLQQALTATGDEQQWRDQQGRRICWADANGMLHCVCPGFGGVDTPFCNAGALTPHNLLSPTHTDTIPFTPPNIGDLIRGNNTNGPNLWERFPITPNVGWILTAVGAPPIPQWQPPPTATLTRPCANAGVGGTQLNKLATISNGACLLPSTGQLVDIEGVCIAGCGTVGLATIQYAGSVFIQFDGSTTAGDEAFGSTIPGQEGKAHDSGIVASNLLTDQILYIGEPLCVIETTNVGPGLYKCDFGDTHPSPTPNSAFPSPPASAFNSASIFYTIPRVDSQFGHLAQTGLYYKHGAFVGPPHDAWYFGDVGTNKFPDDSTTQITQEQPSITTLNMYSWRVLSGGNFEQRNVWKVADENLGLTEIALSTAYQLVAGNDLIPTVPCGYYPNLNNYHFPSAGTDCRLQAITGVNTLATNGITGIWGVVGQLGTNSSGNLTATGSIQELSYDASPLAPGDYIRNSPVTIGRAQDVGLVPAFVGQTLGRSLTNSNSVGTSAGRTLLFGAEVRGGPFGIGLQNQSLAATTGPTTLVPANTLPVDSQIEICVQQITTTGVAITTAVTTATYNDENNLSQTDTVAASLATIAQGNHNGGCITPWIKANVAVTLTTTIVGAPTVSVRSRAFSIGATF